jgi:hypothetical protein
MREGSTGGRGQIFKDLKKSSGGANGFITRKRSSRSWSSQRKKSTKVEAFGRFGILPSIGRKCASSGENNSRWIDGEKRSGPLVATSREEYRRRKLWTIGCSYRNPIIRWIGRRCSELSLWSKRIRRMDLNRQILSRYPLAVGLDRSCMRVTIGTSTIVKSGFSRSRNLRHFKSRNTGVIWIVRWWRR